MANDSTDKSLDNFVLPDLLDQVRIASLPDTAYYISDFITEEEERFILDKIQSAPKPRWKQLTHRRLQTWPSDLVNNKLMDAPLPTWLSEPIVPRLKSIQRSKDASDPNDVFVDSPHQKPNHVLINALLYYQQTSETLSESSALVACYVPRYEHEYPPGIGIMPHKDGAAYHPVVCTISLGASLCLNIHKTRDDGTLDPEPAWRILQEPRSLLIITEALYTDFLHGIADIGEDTELSEHTIANWHLLRSPHEFAEGRNIRKTRTSLTYRDVMKVSKLGGKLGLFQKK